MLILQRAQTVLHWQLPHCPVSFTAPARERLFILVLLLLELMLTHDYNLTTDLLDREIRVDFHQSSNTNYMDSISAVRW